MSDSQQEKPPQPAEPAVPAPETLPNAVPILPVPGQSRGGDFAPGQASAAVPVVPVETEAYPRRGLTWITLLLTIFLAYFLYKVEIVVITLIVGILFATAITGPTELLTHRLRIPRPLAILLVYIAILLGLALFFYLIIPPVLQEATRFAKELPDLITKWHDQLINSGNPIISNLTQRAYDVITHLQSGEQDLPVSPNIAVNVVSQLGGGLVTLFTTLLIAFYWITEKALIKRAIVGLFAPGQRSRVIHLWSEVETKLGSWIRGQLLLMAVIGTAATIAYGLMGLPFWLILGVIAGLTEAIPNVGPILGAIPAVLIALTVDWKLALGVIAFVTVLQLVENAVLVPRIMKNAVGLSPLTVILAILAGSEFRGVAGALLAVPIAGAISVILSDLLREKREREQLHAASTRSWVRQAWQWRRKAKEDAADAALD